MCLCVDVYAHIYVGCVCVCELAGVCVRFFLTSRTPPTMKRQDDVMFRASPSDPFLVPPLLKALFPDLAHLLSFLDILRLIKNARSSDAKNNCHCFSAAENWRRSRQPAACANCFSGRWVRPTSLFPKVSLGLKMKGGSVMDP